jgi:drug/metabolite transporter (DMT)-like permease
LSAAKTTLQRRQSSARLVLVLSAASFGGTWVAGPWATADLPPLVIACLRFAIAASLLYLWCRARGLRIDLRREDLPLVLGVTATSVVAYNILFLYGVRLAPASHGAVIVPGLIPIVTLGLARIAFGERVAARRAAGAVVSLVGLGLVVGPAFAGDPQALLGDLLFVGGAMVWAVYAILGRAATRRFNPAVITFLSAALGAAILAVLSVVLEPGGFGLVIGASLRALGGVAYLGTFGTVLSFVLFYIGVQRIGSARASAYGVLIPLFGVAATVTLLGERVDMVALLGAGMVVAGLWLTQAQDEPPGESTEGDGGDPGPARLVVSRGRD